ncbi:hypothetical protein NW765_003540 [Fusarium oxysporum]|nr:hypothetical protein NW765_003540 [Fusarium oxysporum]
MDTSSVKPSPPQQAPTVEEPTTCRECRRRKVKCDGVMPVCSICRKYRRHCLYDKHSRTRLTRRQLTLLEERLEKAETVLRRHYTDGQIAEMLEGPKEGLVTQNQQVPAATPATAPESAPTPALTLGTTPALVSLPNTTPTPGNVDNLLQLPNQTPDPSIYMTGTGNAGTFTTDPLLLAPIGELDAAPGLWTASQDTAFRPLQLQPTTSSGTNKRPHGGHMIQRLGL